MEVRWVPPAPSKEADSLGSAHECTLLGGPVRDVAPAVPVLIGCMCTCEHAELLQYALLVLGTEWNLPACIIQQDGRMAGFSIFPMLKLSHCGDIYICMYWFFCSVIWSCDVWVLCSFALHSWGAEVGMLSIHASRVGQL